MKYFWICLGFLIATQSTAQAQNPVGLTAILALPAGKTQFQQGEIVPLALSFTSTRPGTYRMRLWSFGTMETLHVSPAATNPMADVPPQRFFSYNGPPPPAPVPISDKPVTTRLAANETLRFDHPGTYQLYVTSARVIEGTPKANSLFSDGKTVETTSNTVQFEIIPTDPAWAHAQAKSALAEIHSHGQARAALGSPWELLRYLGTHEAAQMLLSIMAEDKFPRSSESHGTECRLGLIGCPDRLWLISEMERDLTAPGYEVTQPFLAALTELQTYQLKPKVDRSLARTDWLRAANSASGKTNAARPMTLHTLLEIAWMDPAVGLDPAVSAHIPTLKRQMALDFDRLPPLPQEYLLSDEWEKFQSPALLPALRRLWAAANLTENEGIWPSRETLNGLILRRLHDLSPQEGKALIVKEIAVPEPRADIVGLGCLPDLVLSEADGILARKLAAGSTDDLTYALIARYATAAIIPQVQARTRNSLDARTNVSLLAYFLRVRPSYGKRLVHQTLQEWAGQGYLDGLLGEIAAVWYGPALEEIALSALGSSSPGIVSDAARTLGQYGSPAAEPALWKRLRKRDSAGRSRRIVESGIAGALGSGQAWYESPARLKQVRALCVTEEARQMVGDLLRQDGTSLVSVYCLSDSNDWSVGHYNGRGQAAFLGKLAQYPRGTHFQWQNVRFGREAERLYAEAQGVAHTHGLILKRDPPVSAGG